MSLDVSPCRPQDLDALRTIVGDAALGSQFEMETRAGIEAVFRNPHVTAVDIGRLDGPAGASMLIVWPSTGGPRSMLRVGVMPAARRRGLGTALLDAAVARLAGLADDARPAELCSSAWLPTETAPAFMAHHGFEHARYFWTMERPGASAPEPEWPAGIETRRFDGSDRMLSDWNDAYNRSFARHYLSVTSTIADCRATAAMSHFRADGLLLAYRGEQVVGFCRDAIFTDVGELDALGVVPEARGIGLGRSLVRWGVRWLLEQDAPRVRLLVDGENDNALALYRSEGFAPIRTRQVWRRDTAALIDSRRRSAAGTKPRSAGRT